MTRSLLSMASLASGCTRFAQMRAAASMHDVGALTNLANVCLLRLLPQKKKRRITSDAGIATLPFPRLKNSRGYASL
jgi:hypothetical protein